MNAKPRLRRVYGTWVCTGNGFLAEAATPYSAYIKWQRTLANRTYLRGKQWPTGSKTS